METREDLARYFNSLGFTFGVEVGTAGAHYTEVLCRNIPGVNLICVDPWSTYKANKRGGKQEQHDANEARFMRIAEEYGISAYKLFSTEAMREFDDDSLDFVYIDGNHDFDYVMEDIIGWTRKVRPGGIVSGHDYYHFRNSGVIEAVDFYTKIHKKKLNIIGECKAERKDDTHPNWWFVK